MVANVDRQTNGRMENRIPIYHAMLAAGTTNMYVLERAQAFGISLPWKPNFDSPFETSFFSLYQALSQREGEMIAKRKHVQNNSN